MPKWLRVPLPRLTLIAEAQGAAKPAGLPCLYSLALEWAESCHCTSFQVICLQIDSSNPWRRLCSLPPSSLCPHLSVVSTRYPYHSPQSGRVNHQTPMQEVWAESCPTQVLCTTKPSILSEEHIAKSFLSKVMLLMSLANRCFIDMLVNGVNGNVCAILSLGSHTYKWPGGCIFI